MDAGELSDLTVPFSACLNEDSSGLKLRDHRVQIVDSKVNHPLLFGAPKIVRVLRKGRKDRVPGTLLPRQRVELVHTEMLFIPPSKRLWIARAEKQTAYAIHFLQNQPNRDQLTSRVSHPARFIWPKISWGFGGEAPNNKKRKGRP